MQKKVIIPVFILLILSGCGPTKSVKQGKTPVNNGDMTVAAGQKPKVSFFDKDIGGFEEIETFVLDDEIDAIAKPDSSAPTLAWSEPTEKSDLQKQVLYFEYDSCKPCAGEQHKIPAIKTQINDWINQGYKVVFKGHSCKWHGTRSYNFALSQQRAQWFAEQCLDSSLFDHSKIFGVGNEEPIVFDSTLEGNAPNRRVEIYPLAV